jgi:anti-sigma factor RsiW
MPGAATEMDLHAYIDGELSPERAAEIEAAMARDPILAARVRDFQADKQAVIDAYSRLTDAPLPAVLLKAAWTGSAPKPPRHRARTIAFALAGVAALAACLLLTLSRRAPGNPAIEQAIMARDNARTPSRELTGHDLASIDAADQAMSDMLGNRVRVPDLTRAGFELVSADIYGQKRSDAVQLRYQDAQRRLFTVFLRPSAGPDAFEVTARGLVRICVWQNADLTAVMAGEMSTPELFRLASMTYSSLGL